MRPRSDGGLVLTLVGCLGLMAAIAGTAELVGQGLPGREPAAAPHFAYAGIAQTSGSADRGHTLDPRPNPTSPPARRITTGAAVPATSPTPPPSASPSIGQGAPPGDQPMAAGPRS
jgi:hypothetical protein